GPSVAPSEPAQHSRRAHWICRGRRAILVQSFAPPGGFVPEPANRALKLDLGPSTSLRTGLRRVLNAAASAVVVVPVGVVAQGTGSTLARETDRRAPLLEAKAIA